jgi:hypothetical protein
MSNSLLDASDSLAFNDLEGFADCRPERALM